MERQACGLPIGGVKPPSQGATYLLPVFNSGVLMTSIPAPQSSHTIEWVVQPHPGSVFNSPS